MAILTSYVQLTVMWVLYHRSLTLFHSCSSLFAADIDELIFPLFDGLSETADIAPVFNSTLTFPKILLACCMAESSHLQNACCTDSNDL